MLGWSVRAFFYYTFLLAHLVAILSSFTSSLTVFSSLAGRFKFWDFLVGVWDTLLAVKAVSLLECFTKSESGLRARDYFGKSFEGCW